MDTVATRTLSAYNRFSATLAERLAVHDDVVAVIMVEACNMPRIDARFGRAERDRLLARLSAEIEDAIRDADTLARIGEHSFAVIVPGLRNPGHARLAARKLLRLTDADALSPGNELAFVELRVGMALAPDNARVADELLRCAQLALEVAKESKQDLVVYDRESVGKTAVSWDIRDDLAEAIHEGELDVYYQPKIRLGSHEVHGAEALVRWFSSTRGPVPPDQFIPVAEQSELIQPLTRFVLNSAMRSMMMWQRDGHDIGVAVNLPTSMLLDRGIVDMLQGLLSIWDIQHGRLTLELTESAIMADVDTCFATMSRLKELGCRISIDDFGTGYSSFSYFKNIPADELKIDRAFIAGMTHDTADQRIIETIIGLAHAFDMQVVAEGVEDHESLAMLERLGCDVAQGYFISEPLSGGEYDAWLDARRYAQPEA